MGKPSRPTEAGIELDLSTGEVRRGGRRLRLAPQPFRVLVLLARNPGELVPRESIRKQLWGEHSSVDFEHGLNFCIRQIRRVLGDSAHRPRIIETLPRRGYRLLLSARTLAKRDVTAVAPHSAAGSGDRSAQPQAVAILIADFENLSGEARISWLATGLAETLTTDLRVLCGARVLPRSPVPLDLTGIDRSEQSDVADTLVAAGRAAGAHWILGGSYQFSGARLRFTVRLFDVNAGDFVPVPRVDGDWTELFDLQDRVVRALVRAMGMVVDDSKAEIVAAPQTRLLEAYEEYAKARSELQQLGQDSLKRAQRHFRSAIALDGDYAMAHSGLGAAYAMSFIRQADAAVLARARAHLERARSLDPELAEPYPWLCYVQMRAGRIAEAVATGQRGVALLPDLAHAQYFLGAALFVGAELDPTRYEAAGVHLRLAADADPRWTPSWFLLAYLALLRGEYVDAIANADRLIALSGDGDATRFVGAALIRGQAALRSGRSAEASAHFEQSRRSDGASRHVYRNLVLALSNCGLGDCALRLGRVDEAMVHYRRAWHVVQEFPGTVGHERAGVRALAGLSATYFAQGQRRAGDETLATTMQWLERARPPQHAGPAAAMCEGIHAIAVALMRAGKQQAAMEQLERAVASGWLDADWLERDPELHSLPQQARLRLMQRIQTLSRGVRAPATLIATASAARLHEPADSGRT